MVMPPRWSFKDVQSLAGVLSSLGIATFLVVIIGRLWTTAYFEHFGVPSSSLEFSVYDYAFRSLEALISLALGAIGLSAAWLNRDWLRQRGMKSATFELALAGLLLFWVLWVLPRLDKGCYAPTGVLGLSAGLPLAAMIWFAVDVSEGPGQETGWGRRTRALLGVWPISRLVANTVYARVAAMRLTWRIVGVVLLLAVGFGYLPTVSEKLAIMEAKADLATGELPAAVLEADSPLPRAIASDAKDAESHVVRILLTQSQNTYVLHSTQCTTIGQLDVPTRVEREGEFMPPEGPDVCKVLAIPTARLKSIEYLKVRGKAPANESRAHALQVGLDEQFSESVNTQGATDEEDEDPDHRLCERETARFHNSVWYAFQPATDGAVFVRAQTADFSPVIGVWEEPEPLGALKPVTGSNALTGLACETNVGKTNNEVETNVVAAIAKVQGDTRYVAAIAAQGDKAGDVRVSFRFYPGAHLLNPAAESKQAREWSQRVAGIRYGSDLPSAKLRSQVLAVTARGRALSQLTTATLKLWDFDRERCELRSPSTELEEATLVTEDTRYTLTRVSEDEEAPPARFEATLCGLQEKKPCAEPSYVEIEVDPTFVGLGSVSMSIEPAVVLSLSGTAYMPLRDVRVQAALLLALQESAIRDSLGYGGEVVFDPECHEPEALPVGVAAVDDVGDRELAARGLLEEAGFPEGFAIQIQVEEETQLLADAAEIVRDRLVGIDLDPSIEPCVDACIRLYFGTPGEE